MCVGGVGAFSLSTSYNEMCGLLKCIALRFQKTHNNQYNGYLLAITCASLLLLALTSGTFAVPFTSKNRFRTHPTSYLLQGRGGLAAGAKFLQVICKACSGKGINPDVLSLNEKRSSDLNGKMVNLRLDLAVYQKR